MLLKSFIPELDVWFDKTLYNNDHGSKYINHSVKLSDKWISDDSVVNLLFNETFDPSGNKYDDHYFIYKYRTCNLEKLESFDKTFYRRTQIYRNRMYVWACDDPRNSDLQEIENLTIDPWIINPVDTCDEVAQRAGVHPSEYVTRYKSNIITTTNDPLHQEWIKTEPYPPAPYPPSYSPDTNVFKLTQEELEMLDILYYYRTGQFEMICCFPDDFYNTLVSPLSKWIFLFIQCYLFNNINYKYLNTITTKSDGQLRCMFEKHIQDRIYEYIDKQYCTIYNKVDEVGGRLKREFIDYTMPCNTFVCRKRILTLDIEHGEIDIPFDEEYQPITRNNFEFIYNGEILKQGVDYEVINRGTLKDTHVYVTLKDVTKFKIDSKYHLMWSSLILTSPQNQTCFNNNVCGGRRVINIYCNDCGDGSSKYGTEYGRNIPRPVLIEKMIEIHNLNTDSHPELIRKINEVSGTVTNHIQRTDNPHNVTKFQIGLGNVDNTSDADKPLSNVAKQKFKEVDTRLTKAEKEIEEIDRQFDEKIEKKVNKIFDEEQFVINGDNNNF